MSDAIELFIATTMQSYGAAQLLDSVRAKHPVGAVTPIEAVLASVKAAIAGSQQ